MLVWLDQVECQEVTLVGGKAANLSRLLALHPVPPGFCLTTEAHAQWAVGQETNTVPDAARELLTTAYATLAARCQMAEPHVAVRSSAVGEDSQSASFAGQYETYLNIGINSIGSRMHSGNSPLSRGPVGPRRRPQKDHTDIPGRINSHRRWISLAALAYSRRLAP